jgi:hypothetical protein
MAILSRDKIPQLIQSPKNQREISRARAKRARHQLHTQPETDTEPGTYSEAHNRFLSWVKSLLRSDDNYDRFLGLYRPPVPTNELVESIYSEFQKVFSGSNAFEKFEFSSPELEADFTAYRKRIGDMNFWETQGFETFKNSIDNVLVVDLPKLEKDPAGNFIQKSDRPEPYYYVLDIDALIDIENSKIRGVDSDGKPFYYFKTEYLIFKGEGDLVFVFDDAHYRIYQKKDSDYSFVDEIPHGLGYCPASSFWTTPLNSCSNVLKKGVITNSLSELDWLLFFTIAERFLQLYAPFPIYAVYKGKCDYKEDGGLKRRCVEGFLEVEGARSLPHNRERCPKCRNMIKVGPGNILELRVPRDKEDADLMANPIKVIPAERDSLDYMKEALADMRKNIFVNCVGRSQDPKNDQAQNEKQVASTFESTESVLLNVKRNFEIAQEFALETVARLRYGSGFISATVNYGDQFFNKDEKTEIEEYKIAQENNLPEYELELRRDDINIARYRNNPKQLERLRILKHLLPFPGITLEKVAEMRRNTPELVSKKDLVVKMKFNEFVNRFEREQTDVNIYASALEFDRKITLIREELDKYATEYLDANKETPAAGSPGSGTPGGDLLDTPVDIEAEAKAKLKGSVGGVQGILAIQTSVSQGLTDYDAAIALLREIFGFDDVKAAATLGPRPAKKAPAPGPAPIPAG